MTTLTLDSGMPFPVRDEGSGRTLALFTDVCPSARCGVLHLHAAEVSDPDAFVSDLKRDARLAFGLDVATRELRATNDEAGAYLASERGAALRAWIERHADELQSRFGRLKGQRAGEPADARPAPPWRPGELVFHSQLYPHDFTPTIVRDGRTWMIACASCPDPGCDCNDVRLVFQGPEEGSVEVSGRFGERRPEKADRTGRALWEAVHANEDLVAFLQERRDEIRFAGPFVVGSAYEKARLASQKERGEPALEPDGGYLRGGAIPVARVRRLFDVSARLHAARVAVDVAWWSWFRIEVRGALTRDAWGRLEEEPWGFSLYEAPAGEAPWLDFAVAPHDAATLAHRRQRSALGLPLLAGTSLPLVHRVGPDGSFDEAGADDVALAIAVGEALLAATPELVDEEEVPAPRVFEHRVELDAGTVDVRLTASHAEAPWNEEDNPYAGDGDEVEEDHEGDDDGDDEGPSGEDLVDTAREAFTDAALDRGLPAGELAAARSLIGMLGDYAAEQGGLWFEASTITTFLKDYAPRKVVLDDAQIERVPAALRAVADWLCDVGYDGARQLRASLDRALGTFQKRARDPRFFGPSKGLLMEMRAAGVDVEDPTAIDRYLAVRNAAQSGARSAKPSPARAGDAGVSRSPNRWKPAPGERPPAPNDPCGCGSGRRYKKCCMPR